MMSKDLTSLVLWADFFSFLDYCLQGTYVSIKLNFNNLNDILPFAIVFKTNDENKINGRKVTEKMSHRNMPHTAVHSTLDSSAEICVRICSTIVLVRKG